MYNVAASPSQYVTQPSGIPPLSPVLFMHVGDPYIAFNLRVELYVCVNYKMHPD